MTALPRLPASSWFVYRLFDEEDIVLYVGYTSRTVHARIAEHRSDKQWWSEVARVAVEEFGSELDARRAESRAIAVERPRYNVDGRRTLQAAPDDDGPFDPDAILVRIAAAGERAAQADVAMAEASAALRDVCLRRLKGGDGPASVARAAGISRRTVYKWMDAEK